MRSYLVGLALLVAGGIVCVAIPGLTWATVELEGRLATAQVAVAGRELLPLAPAGGLLAFAAVVATHATRRLGRMLVGVVVLAAGGAVAAWAVWLSADVAHAATSWLERSPEHDGTVTSAATSPLLAVLTAVGGALIALAGLLTVTRGAHWPAMGARYDRPAAGDPAEAETGQASAREVWDALDRGQDPTVSTPPTRPTP